MKIYIIATEASGDYLGSHLIKELKKKKINSIEGIGGELMKMQGMCSWVPIEKFNTILRREKSTPGLRLVSSARKHLFDLD